MIKRITTNRQAATTPSTGAGRAGFTLIEITVVLAIAAIVSAITLGGFKNLSDGNHRLSCQTNLVQIYQACRLYAADESGGFPYYKPAVTGASPQPAQGIGLWALYTFPDATNYNAIAPIKPNPAPIERYIRHPKILHCPSDFDDGDEQLYTPDKTHFNPLYLSYQVQDDPDLVATTTADDADTYSPERTRDNSAANLANWKRQLLHYSPTDTAAEDRLPDSTTVVTWCKWDHLRSGRAFDNVLFYDGTVRYLPRQQNVTGVPAPVTGWQRVPQG